MPTEQTIYPDGTYVHIRQVGGNPLEITISGFIKNDTGKKFFLEHAKEIGGKQHKKPLLFKRGGPYFLKITPSNKELPETKIPQGEVRIV